MNQQRDIELKELFGIRLLCILGFNNEDAQQIDNDIWVDYETCFKSMEQNGVPMNNRNKIEHIMASAIVNE